ncbi:MAG: methyltransferase domain-containing protein, partial [Planctomycetota bacterium]
MGNDPQDRYYLDVEADAFHERNHADSDPAVLRPHKQRILARLERAGVRPRKVIEFGCAYGDLLNHYATEHDAQAFGVEPSEKAVRKGLEAYEGRARLMRGTIAENEVVADAAQHGTFDLVIVDDVFCWVSRETLFQSVANIDALLADGGHLYIQEFLPLHQTRNRNHHAGELEVWCHKPRGPHLAMFTASGAYEVVYQEVSIDGADGWVSSNEKPPFESRWSN